MSLLGIIGGMGVHATAYFYEMLVQFQHVNTEQEYMDMLIFSKSSTPDRTAFITGQSCENPLMALKQSARVLADAGVSCIAMPCITAHFFYVDLAKSVDVHIINMMEETARYAAAKGYTKIGLLATDGTLHGGLFHKVFAKYGIVVITPSKESQAALMDIIYGIKRGNSDGYIKLEDISNELYKNGAEAVVLGCTELSLLVKGRAHNYIDALAVLAKASLRFASMNK